jgi:DNA-binding CsgD family transcriptional regulator
MIARIYDAAGNLEEWPAFLEDFADAIGGTTTALLFYNWSSPVQNQSIAVRFDPHYAELYRSYYSTINPWLRSWRTLVNRPGVDSVGVSESRMDLADLKKTEFYNDYLRPQDTIHQIGCIITTTSTTCSAFTCLRPSRAGPFGDSEVEFLKQLAPHLQKGIVLYDRITKVQGEHRLALDALDSVPLGIILFDVRCRILNMNRAAREILTQNDGLLAAKDGLTAAVVSENRQLQRFLRDAALTARGDGLSSGGSMAITRPSGRRPFTLLVSPISAGVPFREVNQGAVLVFVSDPESIAHMPHVVLGHLYGLTAAESRVAESLVRGETLVETADRFGISHNTARTHLQRIYEKTGTSHQGQLLRLLLTSVSSVNR